MRRGATLSFVRPLVADPRDVDIVAAKFADLARARAAARDIRVRLRLAPDSIAIGSLGSTQYDEPVSDALLAGQFPDAVTASALAIIDTHGGVILDRRRDDEGQPGNATSSPILAPISETSRDRRRRSIRRSGKSVARSAGWIRRNRAATVEGGKRRAGLGQDSARNGSSR